MNRRVLVPLVVLILMTAVVAFTQAPAAANHAAIEKQIVANERAINDAVAKGDMKAFHANIASDAVGIDGSGISKVNAPEFDKMLQTIKIQTWNIDGSQFYWINDNTVVHMYRWTGKGTYQGQPVPSPVWTSTVWTNRGGKWVATFHQESVAMGPPPAAASSPAKK
jgi:methionine-rich copper-binding protein CopC